MVNPFANGVVMEVATPDKMVAEIESMSKRPWKSTREFEHIRAHGGLRISGNNHGRFRLVLGPGRTASGPADHLNGGSVICVGGWVLLDAGCGGGVAGASAIGFLRGLAFAGELEVLVVLVGRGGGVVGGWLLVVRLGLGLVVIMELGKHAIGVILFFYIFSFHFLFPSIFPFNLSLSIYDLFMHINIL
ncbi:hypothetical protein RJ639_031423 [Escallonia herrerae]|uniref:Uncharacterized protein n=1 Tax=Escallonia herrerae TaxID=1293975 RepID=A0AA89BIX7_9ASTE|nr:hypothetical protein RJ639_031423 [Escallonia herrerae]